MVRRVIVSVACLVLIAYVSVPTMAHAGCPAVNVPRVVDSQLPPWEINRILSWVGQDIADAFWGILEITRGLNAQMRTCEIGPEGGTPSDAYLAGWAWDLMQLHYDFQSVKAEVYYRLREVYGSQPAWRTCEYVDPLTCTLTSYDPFDKPECEFFPLFQCGE